MFCLFLILLISCSDVAASIVADETNSGVTALTYTVKRLNILCHRRVGMLKCCHTGFEHAHNCHKVN